MKYPPENYKTLDAMFPFFTLLHFLLKNNSHVRMQI